MSNKVEKIKEAMHMYRDEWDLTHPAPPKGKIRAMDFLQFYLFLPVALLGPFVSAFRTLALLAETAAFQQSPGLVFTEAILGTAFFELGAIVYQVIRLRRKSQEEGGLPKVGTSWIVFGMIITIGAVTTSNFVEVLVAALEKADANFIPSWFTALMIGVFIGPGVAACTVIAGEVVGRFLLEWQAASAEIVKAHKVEMEKWNESFLRSWRGRKGKEFLEAYLHGEKEQFTQKEPERPRSEYSRWRTKDECLTQVVQYVKDHDPERGGVERKEIFDVVWNGRTDEHSPSTKYAYITELIESGRLVEANGNGKRVTWAVEDLSGFE